MIRDEVEQQLGRGRLREFITQMVSRRQEGWALASRTGISASVVDARLERTPWLDASITNPLLLADKAYYVADTRDEVQRRFPELFSHLRDGREADNEVIEPEYD
eukprot:scaffold1411_cov396-Prasinococcus_capsulatus_cf.AAC.13